MKTPIGTARVYETPPMILPRLPREDWEWYIVCITASDGIGLASIWIGGGAPTGFGSGSFDLDAGVAWIEAHGAPGAPQLIPH